MSVSHIHNGQKPMKRIMLNVSDDVPVATYVLYSSAMIIPENAGGSAAEITSILRLKTSIPTKSPNISTTNGISTIFIREPSTTCRLIVNFIAERVMPAENTASEALAFAIKSKDGLSQSGQ